MRYLITGGAGFIGSHLADELLARGHRVHVLDDLSTGSIDNIRHLKAHAGFDYTIDSCANAARRGRARRRGRRRLPPGRRGGRRADRREPGADDRDQRPLHRGRARAGQQEEEAGLHRLDQRGLRQESHDAPVPRGRRPGPRRRPTRAAGPTPARRRSTSSSRSPTGRSASCPTVVGRLFNTVGPRQTGRYGMVVPNFVRQALAEQPITVFGDGIAAALLLPRRRRGARAGRPDGARRRLRRGVQHRLDEEISIRQLAERVRELTGSTSEIHLVPYDEAYEEGFEDMLRRIPDLDQDQATRSAGRRRRASTRSSTTSSRTSGPGHGLVAPDGALPEGDDVSDARPRSL